MNAVSIFLKAQTAWSARAAPPYETFELPCEQTLLADRCAAGTQLEFIVRIADRKYLAQALDARGQPVSVLVRGGDLVGPAGAPFGFFRRDPVPGTALTAATPAPAADPVVTIAHVSAVDRAYDITLAGTSRLGDYDCYHLLLRPLREPQNYPLRELYVDRTSFEIVALTYAQPFNDTYATVHYRFAPAGPQHVWTLVHIDAQARHERVDQDLSGITFPLSEPDADFTP